MIRVLIPFFLLFFLEDYSFVNDSVIICFNRNLFITGSVITLTSCIWEIVKVPSCVIVSN